MKLILVVCKVCYLVQLVGHVELLSIVVLD